MRAISSLLATAFCVAALSMAALLPAGCASSHKPAASPPPASKAIAQSPGTKFVSRFATPRTPAGPYSGVAGQAGERELIIAESGATAASVLVAADAGPSEKLAAQDVAKYIGVMTGATPAVVSDDAAIKAALNGDKPVIVVGKAALAADSDLQKSLDKVAKKNPTLRADAVVVRRKGNKVFAAGLNDQCHYFAAAWLLRQWGCRWYLPTEFGECIPKHARIAVGKLDYVYAPPFEVRGYWISWNGSNEGAKEFKLRNMMNDVSVSTGHALGSYTKELIPQGKSMFEIPIAEDKTAQLVADKISDRFAKGESISLSIEDGVYTSDSPRDVELRGNIWDKYFLTPNLTDNFMVFYNNVAKILQQRHPQSSAKIGFLAYCNVSLPPQRDVVGEKCLIANIAPIDIDPTHSMDDPRSPPRQEYREMMYRWAKAMQGRAFIYDYDQGMLVWRDIPNPVIPNIQPDIKHYRDAGILGVSTESRNAIATIFLNLYVRGWLLWNPDADLDQMLSEFYADFYGPAAVPMAAYWDAIHRAWDETFLTEHEYFVSPAIYTPALVEELRGHLAAAEKIAAGGVAAKVSERLKFTRLSFNLIEQYNAAVRAAATEGDYRKAVEWGDKAIDTRDAIDAMNSTFTTAIKPRGKPSKPVMESGAAWLQGEIDQYRGLVALTDGSKGRLIGKLPVEWAFRRDPNDTGLPMGYAYQPADLTYWKKHGHELTGFDRKDYPTTQWEVVRADLYAQGQGILHPDAQAFTGHLWYKADVDVKSADAAGKPRVHFPGLFGETWLYVNGHLIAHRPQKAMWWLNDYKFEWDVDLTGKLKPGSNDVTLRVKCEHHMGGLFRRPFMYEAKGN